MPSNSEAKKVGHHNEIEKSKDTKSNEIYVNNENSADDETSTEDEISTDEDGNTEDDRSTDSESSAYKALKLSIAGKIPEFIIGATIENNEREMKFLIKWKSVNETTLIPSKLANKLYPQLVIKFYEERIFIVDCINNSIS